MRFSLNKGLADLIKVLLEGSDCHRWLPLSCLSSLKCSSNYHHQTLIYASP